MKRILIALLLLPFALAAGAFWWIAYSPYPVRMTAEALRSEGWEVQELEGSLNSGFTASKLSRKDEAYEVEIEGARFQWGGLNELLVKKRLIVDEIAADKTTFILTRLPSGSKPASAPAQSPSQPTQPPAQGEANGQSQDLFAKLKEQALRELRVNRVQLANVTVKLPLMDQPFKMRTLRLNEFVIGNGKLSLAELSVLSSFYDLTIKGLRGKPGRPAYLDEKIVGSIKPAFWPMLKKDLNFTVTGEWGEQPTYEITALDEKLKVVSKSGQPWTATLQGFTPKEYLNVDVPITELHAEVQTANPAMILAGAFHPKVHFKLGEAMFQSLPPHPDPAQAAQQDPHLYFHEQANAQGTLSYMISFKPIFSRLAMAAVSRAPASVTEQAQQPGQAQQPWFEILSSSQQLKTPQDILAWLHAKKPYAKAGIAERMTVDQQSPFFTLPNR